MKKEEIINNLQNLLQWPELAEKYKDYEPIHCSKITYRAPMNQQEMDIAKNGKKGLMTVMWFVSIILFFVMIWGLFSSESIGVMVIGGICFSFPLLITLFLIFQKIQVTTCTMLTKMPVKKRSTERRPNYEISAIPESGEKVIYRCITTPYFEAQKMEEGTRILVVKILTGAYAYVL